MRRVHRSRPAESQKDEHELLRQEDFSWLAEARKALSPYWAVRMEYVATDPRSAS